MNKVVRGWLTGADNQNYEVGRALWALGTLAMIAYQGVAVWKGQPFSAVEFGAGIGAILAAGGFGVAAKDKGAAAAKTWSEPRG